MGILDDIPALVAGAAGDLLFQSATLSQITARVSDGRGGNSETATAYTVKALLTDYTDYQRHTQGIGASERLIMILGDGLTVVPSAGDIINYDGRDWSVVQVSRDPAKAVYNCRAK